MIRQIGWKWKYGDVWSGPLLIGRGLNQVKNVAFSEIKILSSFERTRFSQKSVVAIAQRLHLFPFRTQKLSFVTPIVVRGSPLARIGSCHAIIMEDQLSWESATLAALRSGVRTPYTPPKLCPIALLSPYNTYQKVKDTTYCYGYILTDKSLLIVVEYGIPINSFVIKFLIKD